MPITLKQQVRNSGAKNQRINSIPLTARAGVTSMKQVAIEQFRVRYLEMGKMQPEEVKV